MTSPPIPATLSHVTLVTSHLDSFYLHFLFSRMGLVMYDWLLGGGEGSLSPSLCFYLGPVNSSSRNELSRFWFTPTKVQIYFVLINCQSYYI